MFDTESLDDLSVRFLIWLHAVTGGDVAKGAFSARFLDTVPDVNVSRATLTAMVKSLEVRRLVRTTGSLASSIQEVRITWEGIVAVSNATDHRRKAAQRALPSTVINNIQVIGGSNFGQAMNGSPMAKQHTAFEALPAEPDPSS